jgi:hypothetical protein
MEKLSSHFMGQAASFPFARYRTEMCREYMRAFFLKCQVSAYAMNETVIPYGETVIPMVHQHFCRLGRFQYQQSALKQPFLCAKHCYLIDNKMHTRQN